MYNVQMYVYTNSAGQGREEGREYECLNDVQMYIHTLYIDVHCTVHIVLSAHLHVHVHASSYFAKAVLVSGEFLRPTSMCLYGICVCGVLLHVHVYVCFCVMWWMRGESWLAIKIFNPPFPDHKAGHTVPKHMFCVWLHGHTVPKHMFCVCCVSCILVYMPFEAL